MVFTSRCGAASGLPSRTPKDIVAKLNAVVVETLADPAVARNASYDIGRGKFTARELQTPEALEAEFQKSKSKNGGRSSKLRTSSRTE